MMTLTVLFTMYKSWILRRYSHIRINEGHHPRQPQIAYFDNTLINGPKQETKMHNKSLQKEYIPERFDLPVVCSQDPLTNVQRAVSLPPNK